MKKIMIQKITQNNWNFWTVNLIMWAKKVLSRFSGTPYRLVLSQKKHWSYHCISITLLKALTLLCVLHAANSSRYDLLSGWPPAWKTGEVQEFESGPKDQEILKQWFHSA